MRDALQPARVANAMRMRRSSRPTLAFLLVEGDTDRRLMEKFVDATRCAIEVGNGRAFVLAVLEEVAQTVTPGVLALIDADFDRLDGAPQPANVVWTDTHDIETLLLRSPALDALLREHGSDTKRAHCEQQHGPIRHTLLRAGRTLGYLRWHSLRTNLSLRFEGIDVSRFVDDQLTVDASATIRYVLQHSNKQQLKVVELGIAVDTLTAPEHDPWNVCCGHDLVAILSHALRKAIGTRNTNDAKPEVLEMGLRLAFERRHFEQTTAYADIRAWETVNPPFVILAA